MLLFKTYSGHPIRVHRVHGGRSIKTFGEISGPLPRFCEPVGLGEQGSFLRQPSLPGVWKKSHDIFRLFRGNPPFAHSRNLVVCSSYGRVTLG